MHKLIAGGFYLYIHFWYMYIDKPFRVFSKLLYIKGGGGGMLQSQLVRLELRTSK